MKSEDLGQRPCSCLYSITAARLVRCEFHEALHARGRAERARWWNHPRARLYVRRRRRRKWAAS